MGSRGPHRLGWWARQAPHTTEPRRSACSVWGPEEGGFTLPGAHGTVKGVVSRGASEPRVHRLMPWHRARDWQVVKFGGYSGKDVDEQSREG